jgi:hypothetical protein
VRHADRGPPGRLQPRGASRTALRVLLWSGPVNTPSHAGELRRENPREPFRAVRFSRSTRPAVEPSGLPRRGPALSRDDRPRLGSDPGWLHAESQGQLPVAVLSWRRRDTVRQHRAHGARRNAGTGSALATGYDPSYQRVDEFGTVNGPRHQPYPLTGEAPGAATALKRGLGGQWADRSDLRAGGRRFDPGWLH